MKKFVSLLLAVSMVFAIFSLPICARWSNTSMVILQHGYIADDESEIYVRIDGYSGATISNVNIKLDRVSGSNLINVASWEGLSSGKMFEFLETTSGVEIYCTYRLSVTADVTIDGVVEKINVYKDNLYKIIN